MTNHPQAVVIGMMGAGKTRVGRETAQLMGLPFLDADVEIERQVACPSPNTSNGTASPRSARSKAI